MKALFRFGGVRGVRGGLVDDCHNSRYVCSNPNTPKVHGCMVCLPTRLNDNRVGKYTIHTRILSRHERVYFMNRRKTQGTLPKFNMETSKNDEFKVWNRPDFSCEPC